VPEGEAAARGVAMDIYANPGIHMRSVFGRKTRKRKLAAFWTFEQALK
jgi:hypothetical protein